MAAGAAGRRAVQRTVFDQVYTPGMAEKIRPSLEREYPPKTHDHIRVPVRDGNRRRVRIVIQRKKEKAR